MNKATKNIDIPRIVTKYAEQDQFKGQSNAHFSINILNLEKYLLINRISTAYDSKKEEDYLIYSMEGKEKLREEERCLFNLIQSDLEYILESNNNTHEEKQRNLCLFLDYLERLNLCKAVFTCQHDLEPDISNPSNKITRISYTIRLSFFNINLVNKEKYPFIEQVHEFSYINRLV